MHKIKSAPFIFNGRDLARFLLVQNVTRAIVPKRKVQTIDAGARTFARPFGLEPMSIKVTCAVMEETAQDVAAARHELAEALYTERPAKLILADDGGTYVNAYYVGGAEPDSLTKYPCVELEFLAPDPIAYGAHHKEEFDKRAQVFTGGTYKTRPRVIVTPSAGTTYWEVRNYTTGKYVGVHANFDGNSQLVIDMQLERTTINRHDIAVDLSSDFFSIRTGDVLMATTEYTIEWEERFI